MKILTGSIDLTKIDKSRIIEGKTGAKYYNILIIINDEKDKYDNDASISEGQTKEEREAKIKKKFIGNAKIVYEKDATSPVNRKQKAINNNDDLPF